MLRMLGSSLSWLLAGALILGSACSCARKPATEQESTPAPPRSVQEADDADRPEASERAEGALRSETKQPEPGSPAPAADEESPLPRAAPRVPESESASQGGSGAGAAPRMEGAKRRSVPAAENKPKSVDSLEDSDAQLSFEQAERELEASFSKLGDELRLSSPDCPTARQLAGRVCQLAEHICRIAERGKDAVRLATCVDGRNRCAEANRRIEGKCNE